MMVSIVFRTVFPRLRSRRKLRAAWTAISSPAISTTVRAVSCFRTVSKVRSSVNPCRTGKDQVTDGQRFGGKQLVELMNGVMGVESSVGRGSVFWYELELTSRAANRRG